MEIFESGPGLGPADVDELEVRTGRRVPGRYRRFLLAHNGGYPEPAVFGFSAPGWPGGEASSIVEGFLGIGVNPTDQIEYCLRVFRDRIPADLYPIARDPGGNFLCMGVDDSPKPGEIVFWHHEEEADEGEPPTRDNLYHVADSLDELLSRLH